MTLESQADFARRCGKSRKTVSGWKKAGRLVLQGDQVCVEESLALIERHRKGGISCVTSAVTLGVTQVDSGNSQGNKPDREATEQQASDAIEDEIAVLPGETIDQAAERLTGVIDVDGTSFDEARRIKEVYLALLNRLEYEKKSNALIEMDVARTVLFNEARRARDAWIAWPSNFGALIAADLGIDAADRVTAVLVKYVHEQISRLGEPQGDEFQETAES